MEYTIVYKTKKDLPYWVIVNNVILFKAESEIDAIDWINERSTLEVNITGELSELEK